MRTEFMPNQDAGSAASRSMSDKERADAVLALIKTAYERHSHPISFAAATEAS